MELWDWTKEQASNVWDWATNNADTVTNAVTNYVGTRINNDERAALLNSRALSGTANPDLSGFRSGTTRSVAGVSSFDEIKEASNNRYASFLYYVKAHLQAKKQYEAVIPSTLRSKTGLGSRT